MSVAGSTVRRMSPNSTGRGRSSASGGSSAASGFTCTECGQHTLKWHGRCPECQAWGTLAEAARPRSPLRRVGVSAGPPAVAARPIAEIDATSARPQATGVDELDRVLGGGLVPGAVVLLAGEPGVGKSTLLLSAAQAWAAAGGGRVLVVTGEESVSQVRLRAGRMGTLHPDLYLAAESDLGAVLGHLDQVQPRLLIVDSVQTIAAGDIDGTAGGVSQVRAVAAELTAVAKERGMACVLVGHVTKDGAIAGPRVLEHLVDVVLHFEGDRHSSLRVVRGVKNRFGPSDEVGCFEMVTDGIVGLADPSGLFLTGRPVPTPGTCTTVALHGRRPLPVEVQALLTPSSGEGSRRTVSGLDSARTAMTLAVVQRWGGVRLAQQDVLAATVGGARVTEPGADLAVALAVWSSARDIPLPPGLVVLGELGLSGDIRPVVGVERRLTEMRRLGFDRAIVPVTTGRTGSGERAGVGRSGSTRRAGGSSGGLRIEGMRIQEVADLGEALQSFGDGSVDWRSRRGS